MSPCVQHYYGISAQSVEGFFVELSENSSLIVKKALSGDSQAWDELFACLWPVAVSVAASIIKERGGLALAEDVAQNVFVRLTADNAKRLRLFNPDRGTLEKYIARISYTCAIDYLRSNAKHLRNTSDATIPEHASAPDDALPSVEEWELAAAMATLTPREREVTELLYKENLENTEAAIRLGISPATVRSEKSHALKKLKKFFRQS